MNSPWSSSAVSNKSLLGALGVTTLTLMACEPEPTKGAAAQIEDLLDPTTCASCHAAQYEQWAGSMHAYASEDPIFRALNRLGQEQTEGKLGQFCVNCHAPMAVALGETTDGLNLDDLPARSQGVTCYFCHNADEVTGSHNNPVVLAFDRTLRGGRSPGNAGETHETSFSPLLDVNHSASSGLCGSCHDVSTEAHFAPAEVLVESTFAEWRASLYGHGDTAITCGGCHMPTSATPERSTRRHDFEGVDLALTPFPGKERQRLLVERALSSTLLLETCVSELGDVEITLENVGAGHSFPSGATFDRRVWLEVIGYDADGDEVFSSGRVEEDQSLELLAIAGSNQFDPLLFQLGQTLLGKDGAPVNFVWDTYELAPSALLPAIATLDPSDGQFHQERKVASYPGVGLGGTLEVVTVRVRVRALAHELLHKLEQEGALTDPPWEELETMTLAPGRCISGEEASVAPDISFGGDDCQPSEDDEFTLVWRRSEVQEDTPTSRGSVVGTAPARCASLPSYLGRGEE